MMTFTQAIRSRQLFNLPF